MATMKSIYNWENPAFAPLHDPMRNVMAAYGNAEKFFAAIKEVVWYKFSMIYTMDLIHRLEHLQPEKVDAFKGYISTIGLPVEYPATPELGEELGDMDKVFEVCVNIVDEIDNALFAFIQAADKAGFRPIGRNVEQLQMENYARKTKLLEAWNMYDQSASPTTFDNWVKNLLDQNTFNPF